MKTTTFNFFGFELPLIRLITVFGFLSFTIALALSLCAYDQPEEVDDEVHSGSKQCLEKKPIEWIKVQQELEDAFEPEKQPLLLN